MRKLRNIFLFPLGLIWGMIALTKRWLYRFFKLSKKPSITTWIIGNIHLGGQGKTPTIISIYEWLILESLKPAEIAILSRGYGRKTKGYHEVSRLDTALTVGDEPLEIFQTIQNNNKEKGSEGPKPEFSNSLLSPVLVCENRIHGLSLIQKHNPTIKLVLLDDGFQHLQLSAHGKIILTKFEDPFTTDLPLPAGNLREFPTASKSADVILVTHTPSDLKKQDAEKWMATFKKQLRFWGVNPNSANWANNIYFSNYSTSTPIEQSVLTHYSSDGKPLTKGHNIILITGVACAKSIIQGLNEFNILYHFEYPDHHPFTSIDAETWLEKHDRSIQQMTIESTHLNTAVDNCVFVCTRKDYMRIMALFLKVSQHPTAIKNLSNTINKTKMINDIRSVKTIRISNLPFYVCHSEIALLFNQKTALLNKILNSLKND